MENKHEPDGGMNSRAKIAWIVFLSVAVLFLITEHWAHLSGWFSYWPYLLLLVCPFMHLFMHGGHGGHIGSHGTNPPRQAPQSHEHGTAKPDTGNL